MGENDSPRAGSAPLVSADTDALSELMLELQDRDERIERLRGVLERKKEESDALFTAYKHTHDQMQELRQLAAAKLGVSLEPAAATAAAAEPPPAEEAAPAPVASEPPADEQAAHGFPERVAQALHEVPQTLRQPLRALDGAADSIRQSWEQGVARGIAEASEWGKVLVSMKKN